MTVPAEKALKPRFGVLRTIALYKLVKVVLLLGVAYGELRLRDASLAAKLLSWAQAKPYGLEHHVVGQILEWFSGLSVSRVNLFRAITLAYATIFAIEGIGLWLEKRWAEWLTTIITASLIPLEAWEIILRPTIGKILILLANVAVVGYLVWHVRRTQASRQTAIVK
jgi:uncharacterized membrane protein (DUF2068 family)